MTRSVPRSHHCRIAEGPISTPRKPSDELQGDAKALVSVVQSCDPQLREVEALSEHVDTDEDATLPNTHRGNDAG